MKNIASLLIAAVIWSGGASAQNVPPTPPMMADMVKECRAYYRGPCACPDQDGCKGKSAYENRKKAKKATLFCFATAEDFRE